MYTCYDCKHFGINCEGIVEPEGYHNNIEDYCERFILNEWRKEMFKPDSKKRLS